MHVRASSSKLRAKRWKPKPISRPPNRCRRHRPDGHALNMNVVGGWGPVCALLASHRKRSSSAARLWFAQGSLHRLNRRANRNAIPWSKHIGTRIGKGGADQRRAFRVESVAVACSGCVVRVHHLPPDPEEAVVKQIPPIPIDPWYLPHRLALTVGTKPMRRDRPRTTGYSEVAAAVKTDRGFASLDRSSRREIASKGGKAAHQKGTAHEWTAEQAREAGRKHNTTRRRRQM